MHLNTLIGQLRLLAISEGISYLLFSFTIPLKYYYQISMPNKIVGLIHGILFILFCIWTLYFANKKKWKIKKTLVCLTSSLIPFATFIIDNKILQQEIK
ncbi:MAG: hypothetical protein CL844_00815 [Crocinitomicaceae bacterium]|nr:hypothetical protein [Crocinitomicaceae bacterium]|tara:strand:+ start:17517 stop:17813 length:297 start_codon:yes stop_codon:yes gene_type:complete